MNKDIELQINDIEGINLSLDVEVKKLEPPLENVDITPNETKQIFKSQDAYGYDTVTVEAIPGGYAKPEGILEITENGTYDVVNYAGVKTNIKYAPRVVAFERYRGTELDYELSNLDPSNLTTMAYMFYRCELIKTLNIPNLCTSSVKQISYIFYQCYDLTTLDVSNWDTSNVTNMVYAFYKCSGLTKLDLSSWDTAKVTTMVYMFSGCTALTHLDIRNFDFTNVNYYTSMLDDVPTNCEIIVKNTTAKNWFKSKFSSWTNVKTVAEYEA